MNRTNNEINLRLVDWRRIGEFDMPVIRKCDFLPTRLTSFNLARTEKDKGSGVHFFIDDYQFERVWRNPTAYLNTLRQFQCVLSPDFSVFVDMPTPMKIWNVYRNRLMGSWWQEKGIRVIPTVGWAEPDSFGYCFAGIEPGGVVAVSNIGTRKTARTKRMWMLGAEEMVKRLRPSAILLYGSSDSFDFGQIEVRLFENANLERLKKICDGE